MPDEVRRGPEWQDEFIPGLTGGLNFINDPEMIPKTDIINGQNLIYDRSSLIRDSGYSTFRGVVRGNPRRAFRHILRAGTADLFLITNDTVYRDVSSQWQYVSNGTDTTVSVDASAGATTIDVADITGFADNDFIGIKLDDGSEHQTQVDGTPAAGVITFDDALPGGGVVSSIGNAVVEAVALVGLGTDHVVAISIPWNDWLVFTNNQDNVKYFDPVAATIQDVTGLPANTKCKSLVVFDASLILINTQEAGSDFPQRIRWSDKADATEWTLGDSGTNDLLDSTDVCHHALRLGPYVAIYRDDSITRLEAVNTTNRRFDFDTVVTGQGVFSTAGVIDMEDTHLMWGNDNFYVYRGAFDVDPVGDKIKDIIFGAQGQFDEALAATAFLTYISAEEAALAFFQTTEGTNPNRAYRYHQRTRQWTGPRDFADEMVGSGDTTLGNDGTTWDELVGTWIDQTWRWNSQSVSGLTNIKLLCDSESNQVHKYDFLSTTDDGTAIEVVLETKDFSNPNFLSRHDYMEFKGCGDSILVEAIIEKPEDPATGLSAIDTITLGTVSPGATPKKIRLFSQFVFRTCRYRFTTTSGFCLFWLGFRFDIEYEW